MGYGEYSHAAHVAITRSRAERPDEETFPQRECHPLMAPRGAIRECRDSDDHPTARPFLFALDVTGSMGEIPRLLATRTLPTFLSVLSDAGVRDPSLCFVAVGHAGHDRAPLQIGQFESATSLVDSWLTRTWLEGGGAGAHEAYELAMVFAARHTRLDSVTKRAQRGFLFLVGDTSPNPAVSRVQAERVLGVDLPGDLPVRELIEELQASWEPFFLVAPGAARGVERVWRDLLGDRVVVLEHAEDAAHVAAGLSALMLGSTDDAERGGRPATLAWFVARLDASGLPRRHAARVARALVPFAASIGRDGVPKLRPGPADLPRGDRPSGWTRT